MDLTSFKLDIDELVDEFTEGKFTTLADMKKVWVAKRFSYIYEAKPTTKSALFMQSLFAHSISHMISTGDLSRRLGELKRLKSLVVDAKENDTRVVPALVKRMLDKNMFLFGFVDIVGRSVNEMVDEITKIQEKRVQIACDRLLSKTRIEDYLHMNLGVELEMKPLKEMSVDYAKAKKLAIKEARNTVGVEDIQHIAEDKKLVGAMVEGMVEEWDAQKEAFYQRTGISRRNEIVAFDGFADELEDLLSK